MRDIHTCVNRACNVLFFTEFVSIDSLTSVWSEWSEETRGWEKEREVTSALKITLLFPFFQWEKKFALSARLRITRSISASRCVGMFYIFIMSHTLCFQSMFLIFQARHVIRPAASMPANGAKLSDHKRLFCIIITFWLFVYEIFGRSRR